MRDFTLTALEARRVLGDFAADFALLFALGRVFIDNYGLKTQRNVRTITFAQI